MRFQPTPLESKTVMTGQMEPLSWFRVRLAEAGQKILIDSNSIMFCQFQNVLTRTRMASRQLAVSAHAPGNEDSPDNTAGVHDDWLMVLLAETGSHRLLCM